MHTAYKITNVLEWKGLSFTIDKSSEKVQIECMDAYGDRIMVGTNKGLLLVYKITPTPGDLKVDIMETRKTFAKKEIKQIAVIEVLGIVISLSDTFISVHELHSLEPLHRLERTKGCTFFAVDLQLRSNPSADTHRSVLMDVERDPSEYVLRLAVFGLKKRVLTYEFSVPSCDWREIKDLPAPENIQMGIWSGKSIFIGSKRDYSLLDEDTGRIAEIYKCSQSQETASGVRIPGNEVLLTFENMSTFVNLQGKPTRNYAINWSDKPLSLEFSYPFIFAVQAKGVEVRNIHSSAYVQMLEFPRAKFFCQWMTNVYIGTPTSCWKLDQLPVQDQIDELMFNEEFTEALAMTKMLTDGELRKKKEVEIQRIHGFHLFHKRSFEAAFTIFADTDIHPQQVIGLFTTLASDDIRAKYTYPFEPIELFKDQLEDALLALVAYLSAKRSEMTKLSDPGDETQRLKRQALNEILDTTLLKCYVEVKPAMVSSLLRLQNCCNIFESEKILKDKAMFAELVTLYNSRKMHIQALDLLMKNKDRPGPLKGLEPTVSYLQRLGPEHIEYILEFSKWVLKADKDAGFAIFAADDFPNLQHLPQDRVCEHLRIHAPELVIQYLEHCIFNWGQMSSKFHNQLVMSYFEDVAGPMQEYIRSLNGKPAAKPGFEPGDLGERRLRLLNFLNSNTSTYSPETLLSRVLNLEGLFEEKAALFGRIGRHDMALSIYVCNIGNRQMAEDYCVRVYDKEKEDAKDVYLSLLKIYLKPGEVDLDAALSLLHQHYQKIDSIKALQLIPANIPVSKLKEFLCSVIGERSRQRRDMQVMRSVHKAEQFQVREELLQYSDRRTTIDDDVCCYTCRKPIKLKAFAVYPNGLVVDLFCLKDPLICPCDNPRCSLIHQ